MIFSYQQSQQKLRNLSTLPLVQGWLGAHILLLFTGLNQFIPFKTELHGATSAQTFFPILLLTNNFIQKTGVNYALLC